MKIYVAHSRNFDFQKELYLPIKNNSLNSEHVFIFPHIESGEPFNSKQLFHDGCDLIVADSYAATGLGIELGWADFLHIPIACIYKKDAKISGSLKVVSKNFFEYSNSEEMIEQILKAISIIDSSASN